MSCSKVGDQSLNVITTESRNPSLDQNGGSQQSERASSQSTRGKVNMIFQGILEMLKAIGSAIAASFKWVLQQMGFVKSQVDQGVSSIAKEALPSIDSIDDKTKKQIQKAIELELNGTFKTQEPNVPNYVCDEDSSDLSLIDYFQRDVGKAYRNSQSASAVELDQTIYLHSSVEKSTLFIIDNNKMKTFNTLLFKFKGEKKIHIIELNNIKISE